MKGERGDEGMMGHTGEKGQKGGTTMASVSPLDSCDPADEYLQKIELADKHVTAVGTRAELPHRLDLTHMTCI